MFVLDSFDFALVGHRVRIYCVKVNLERCTLLRPVSDWAEDLNRLVRAYDGNALTISSILLLRNSPEVIQLRESMERSHLSNKHADGPSSKVESWVLEHNQVRDTLRQVYALVVPDMECMAEYLHGYETWLTPREQDVVALHTFVREHILKVDRKKTRWVWDVTLSITWPQPKEQKHVDQLSSILRNHRYLVTDLGELLTGRELLLAQGFPGAPGETVTEHLSDAAVSGQHNGSAGHRCDRGRGVGQRRLQPTASNRAGSSKQSWHWRKWRHQHRLCLLAGNPHGAPGR